MNGFNTKKKIALVVENLYTEFAQEMIQNAINCSRLYKNIDLVIIAGKYDNSRELKDIRLENYENLGTIKMPITE